MNKHTQTERERERLSESEKEREKYGLRVGERVPIKADNKRVSFVLSIHPRGNNALDIIFGGWPKMLNSTDTT